MKFIWYGFLSALFMWSMLASVQPRGFVNPTVYAKQGTPSFQLQHENTTQLLNGINSERTKHGLTALLADESLTTVAKQRANSMHAGKYYAHQDPITGDFYYDLLGRQGVRYGYSCENLDLSTSVNPSSYVADWLSSNKGHKDCMLNKSVSKIGLAIMHTQTFGEQQYIVVAIHQE
jgi:uncharacterized protein YkwD